MMRFAGRLERDDGKVWRYLFWGWLSFRTPALYTLGAALQLGSTDGLPAFRGLILQLGRVIVFAGYPCAEPWHRVLRGLPAYEDDEWEDDEWWDNDFADGEA